MRLRVALVLFVAAAFAIGCGSPKGRMFTAEFQAIDGEVDGSIFIRALPVVLHDRTGSVTALATSEVLPEDHQGGEISRGRVDPVPDRPDAIRVLWLGGACESDVEMVLTGVADHRDISVEANHPFSMIATGCPALGVPRAVVIEFARPIDPTDVHVEVDVG